MLWHTWLSIWGKRSHGWRMFSWSFSCIKLRWCWHGGKAMRWHDEDDLFPSAEPLVTHAYKLRVLLNPICWYTIQKLSCRYRIYCLFLKHCSLVTTNVIIASWSALNTLTLSVLKSWLCLSQLHLWPFLASLIVHFFLSQASCYYISYGEIIQFSHFWVWGPDCSPMWVTTVNSVGLTQF